MSTMHRVTFQQDGMTYDAEEGQWLYDVNEAAGASVPFACKAGACGTCATQVVQGEESLGPPESPRDSYAGKQWSGPYAISTIVPGGRSRHAYPGGQRQNATGDCRTRFVQGTSRSVLPAYLDCL